jgi:CubicO group peptidase (beta-lactamase class C family)
MSTRKFIKRMILSFVVVLLAAVGWYCWRSFPLISGYAAKNVCSSVFLQGRDVASVKKEELGDFPKSLASIIVDMKDSSVTATVFGLAKRKAIFRKGLGATLVNDITEKELRAQNLFIVPALPLANIDLPFPQGEKKEDSLPAALDAAKLQQAVDYAFAKKQEGITSDVLTRAVLILYDGKLVTEKYADGFNSQTPMLGWSMAKSITGTLVGILVNQGKLKTDQAAPVKEWENASDKRHAITLEDLLQQTSGLRFRESYTGFSEVTNMLFNKGDMAAYTASLSLQHTPGSFFNYSSGNSNILSRIIRTTVGENDYHAFPYRALFYKLGMFNTIMEPDASGTFVGSSYIYSTARDYARFGLLYYQDGTWNGERLLPEGWVKKTQQPPASNPYKNYGYQWWLNGSDEKDINKKAYPGIPDDMYYADGYAGQDIYIIPSKKLVIVRLGVNGMDEDGFLRKVVAAVRN